MASWASLMRGFWGGCAKMNTGKDIWTPSGKPIKCLKMNRTCSSHSKFWFKSEKKSSNKQRPKKSKLETNGKYLSKLAMVGRASLKGNLMSLGKSKKLKIPKLFLTWCRWTARLIVATFRRKWVIAVRWPKKTKYRIFCIPTRTSQSKSWIRFRNSSIQFSASTLWLGWSLTLMLRHSTIWLRTETIVWFAFLKSTVLIETKMIFLKTWHW